MQTIVLVCCKRSKLWPLGLQGKSSCGARSIPLLHKLRSCTGPILGAWKYARKNRSDALKRNGCEQRVNYSQWRAEMNAVEACANNYIGGGPRNGSGLSNLGMITARPVRALSKIASMIRWSCSPSSPGV